jgi:hypothetical protein
MNDRKDGTKSTRIMGITYVSLQMTLSEIEPLSVQTIASLQVLINSRVSRCLWLRKQWVTTVRRITILKVKNCIKLEICVRTNLSTSWIKWKSYLDRNFGRTDWRAIWLRPHCAPFGSYSWKENAFKTPSIHADIINTIVFFSPRAVDRVSDKLAVVISFIVKFRQCSLSTNIVIAQVTRTNA